MDFASPFSCIAIATRGNGCSVVISGSDTLYGHGRGNQQVSAIRQDLDIGIVTADIKSTVD